MIGNKLLDDDEIREHIRKLYELTINGNISWKCDEYLPVALIVGVETDGYSEKQQEFCHCANLSYITKKGSRFILDISESISIDGDMQGIIGTELHIYDPEGNLLYCKDLSISVDDDDEFDFVKLCDVIFAQSEDWIVEEFFSNFDEHSLFPSTNITRSHKKLPISRLIKQLMYERRVRDFHRMVFDREYRELLLSELK